MGAAACDWHFILPKPASMRPCVPILAQLRAELLHFQPRKILRNANSIVLSHYRSSLYDAKVFISVCDDLPKTLIVLATPGFFAPAVAYSERWSSSVCLFLFGKSCKKAIKRLVITATNKEYSFFKSVRPIDLWVSWEKTWALRRVILRSHLLFNLYSCFVYHAEISAMYTSATCTTAEHVAE